jgi:branched-chain amino acid transport system permease protein
MIAFGFALERVMLRKLIGRPVIAVVMATIGLAAILRGIGPTTFGAGSRPLPLPIRTSPSCSARCSSRPSSSWAAS